MRHTQTHAWGGTLPAWVLTTLLSGALPAAAQGDVGCAGKQALRFINGRIHTMDRQDRVVSSALIENGEFSAVGRPGTPSPRCTKVIDLQGRTVVPGLIDNHNHIVLLGLRPGHDVRQIGRAHV